MTVSRDPATDTCAARAAEAAALVNSAASPVLRWWWSRDEERFYGPCFSRSEAIMEAWADDPDQGAWICRAAAGEWSCRIIDGEQLQDMFDDANEERGDPDGDVPSAGFPAAAWAKLATDVNDLVRQMVRRHGSASWGFAHQEGAEWVDIPRMWAAAAPAPETPEPGDQSACEASDAAKVERARSREATSPTGTK